jgi:membrane associated rhomboid family serine protease
MIPIRDNNPKGYFPFINYIFIVLNIYIFFKQPVNGEALKTFFYTYGVIPENLSNIFSHLINQKFSVLLSLITSIFVHGDLLHLIGNMLFLWVFGDNIEYVLGHIKYIFFFLLCGIMATLTQFFISPHSTLPIIGASGAISGILGAYLFKFPSNRVTVLFILFIFIRTIKVPAIVVLGFWFFYQIIQGYFFWEKQGMGGVAWFAHIGGFISGIILIKVFEFLPKKKY